MKKIIILIEFFSEDYYESLDLIHLSKFFEINIISYNTAVIKNNYNNIKIISLKSDDEVIDLLENLNADYFFIGIYPLIHNKIFNYLKLKKFFTCSIHYLNPTPASKENLVKSILKFNIIKRWIDFVLKREFSYNIVFTAGNIYKQKFKHIGQINIDTISREYLFWFKKKIKPGNKNNIVFIDDGVGDHFDEYLLNFQRKNDEEYKYYIELREFLNNIQNKTKKKIIVSLHPKRKELLEHPYKGFQTKIGKTLELICNSDFVIATNSLSIHYAILLDKPIILITSSNIPHEPIKKYVKSWSEEINCDLINISDQNYILDLSFKNYNKNYKSLIKNYLNSNHDSKKKIISIWEDFINKYA